MGQWRHARWEELWAGSQGFWSLLFPELHFPYQDPEAVG